MAGTPRPDSVTTSVLRRVRGRGRGSVFVPRDFLDLGTRGAIDVALHRLVRDGVLRRLGRGLYDYPKIHDRFGSLTPPLDAVAHALARSNASMIVPSEAAAANALGLSTQVPAQAVYLTNGPSRTVKVGTRTIRFAHASPARLAGGDTKAGSLLRALRHLRRDDLTDAHIDKLRATLSSNDRQALRKLSREAPARLQPILDRLTADASRLAG